MSDAAGSRNTTMYALAKELHARNLTDKAVRDRVLTANQQFKEPLTEEEVMTTILAPLSQQKRVAA